MKKDTVFYIKELCEKADCRYDIENDRFIKREDDIRESLKWTVRRELMPIVKRVAYDAFSTRDI